MRHVPPRWLAILPVAALALGIPLLTLAVAQPACQPTRPDALGPMYTPNAPERAKTGQGLVVSGAVRSASGCGPIADARIEWWSVNPRGQYDDDHRATLRVDAEGRYRYETDVPVGYMRRPAHVHVRVTAPGHRTLVTQLYPKPGETAISMDFVLVRE